MIEISKKHTINGLIVYSKKIKTQELPEIKEKLGPKDIPSKNKRKIWLWLGIVLAILILAGIGTWIVMKKPTFLGSKVNMKVSLPKEAISGAEIYLTLEYTNGEDVNLENVEIKAFWPEGFDFISSEPNTFENTSDTWKPDQIEKGSSGTINIKGKLFGEINSGKPWKFKLTYKPANVSSYFSKETEAASQITSTALGVLSELPETIASGDEITWTIKYSNKEANTLDKIKIEVQYPEGFEFQEAEPKPSKENNLWENISLEANEEAELIIKGKISGNLDESKTFQAILGLVDAKGQFWLQQKIENSTKIIEAKLEISHSQNKEIANLGEEIEYKTTLKNKGSLAVENLIVTNEIDTRLLDSTSIQVENGKFDGQKLIWDKSSLASLAGIEPGQEVQVSFKAKVVSNIKVQNAGEKNFVVKNKSKIEGEVGGKKNNWESIEVSCKIATLVSLESEAHYVDYEGKTIGSGPIPPEVGKKTSYVIYWQIKNQTNDLQNAKVQAVLPSGVSWTGKTTATSGSISFDSKTRKITWEIGTVPAYSGSLVLGLEATFEVSIIPKKEDLGKVLLLLDDALFFGRDSFTGREITDQAPALDTNLPFDIKAKGKGRVVENTEEGCPTCQD